MLNWFKRKRKIDYNKDIPIKQCTICGANYTLLGVEPAICHKCYAKEEIKEEKTPFSMLKYSMGQHDYARHRKHFMKCVEFLKEMREIKEKGNMAEIIYQVVDIEDYPGYWAAHYRCKACGWVKDSYSKHECKDKISHGNEGGIGVACTISMVNVKDDLIKVLKINLEELSKALEEKNKEIEILNADLIHKCQYNINLHIENDYHKTMVRHLESVIENLQKKLREERCQCHGKDKCT